MNQFFMTSVWAGKDSELLENMLKFYPTSTETVVDVTFNNGVMWKGVTSVKPIGVDINPNCNAHVTADFSSIPFLPDASVDVVVFDPPHLPAGAASVGSSKVWEFRYGITEANKGDNVSSLFGKFFKEASRYVKAGGVVFAKITDLVHNHRQQWQHIDLIAEGQQNGFTACDLIIKTRTTGLHSSKWKNMTHARKFHCYWIVLRKGLVCE